jgi:hypothetical protein
MAPALLLSIVLSPAGYRYGGTFIGAVICSDGIVIASDSRTTFIDSDGKGFGYVDGMPKIYVGSGAVIAVSGHTSLRGELFSSFVQRNQYLLDRPVNEALFGLLVWLPFQNSNNVGMLSAGFVNGRPLLCAKSPIVAQTCTSAGFFGNKNSTFLADTLNKLGRLPTTAEGTAALRTVIEQYAQTDPTVGGPISILKITKDGPPRWIQNEPSDRGLTHVCQVVSEHRKRRLRIVPVGTLQELDRHLNAACPKEMN